jgi:intracellular septation protein
MQIVLSFAPFIVFALLTRVMGVDMSLWAAAILSASLIARNRMAGGSIKVLEAGTVLLFGLLALYATATQVQWSIPFVRIVVDSGLVAIVLISILIRQPFTLQYAREAAPAEVQASPAFPRVNYVISAVWAFALAIVVCADLAMEFAPGVPIWAETVVLVAALVGAVHFTQWYPERVRSQFAATRASRRLKSGAYVLVSQADGGFPENFAARTAHPAGAERPMRDLLAAGKFLLFDLASTLFFLVLFLATKNIPLSVALGVALGVAQIGWEFIRKKPIDSMQWLSLFLVVASGAATLLTNDPRFVMIKPSLIYSAVGVVMLKPGWMNRYLPAVAMAVVPDIALSFGFVWSGLMFFSAALNLIVAMNFSVVAWAAFMSAYGIVSKLILFLIQYATMRFIGVRRRRATPIPSQDGLTTPLRQ